MKKIVIWPANLASGRTRSQGRAVPRRLSLRSPKVEEIEEVALRLNLQPEVERGKAYPKRHWDKSGRVLVAKVDRKGAILREIAEGIKELRMQQQKRSKHKA